LTKKETARGAPRRDKKTRRTKDAPLEDLFERRYSGERTTRNKWQARACEQPGQINERLGVRGGAGGQVNRTSHEEVLKKNYCEGLTTVVSNAKPKRSMGTLRRKTPYLRPSNIDITSVRKTYILISSGGLVEHTHRRLSSTTLNLPQRTARTLEAQKGVYAEQYGKSRDKGLHEAFALRAVLPQKQIPGDTTSAMKKKNPNLSKKRSTEDISGSRAEAEKKNRGAAPLKWVSRHVSRETWQVCGAWCFPVAGEGKKKDVTHRGEG